MKFKAIATAYKSKEELRVLEAPDSEQWISNGVAMYSLCGMPKLSAKSVLNILDVPPEKQNEWTTSEQTMDSELLRLCANNSVSTFNALEKMETELVWGSEKYIFFRNNSEVLAVNEKYLKPLYDEGAYLRFYKLNAYDNKVSFILVYKGLDEIKGIILPASLSDALAELCSITTGLYIASSEIQSKSEEEDEDETS